MCRCGQESERILDVDQWQCQRSCDCGQTGEKKETSGAGTWLQSMWYTKLEDINVTDSPVHTSDGPQNPHLLSMLWEHACWHEVLVQTYSLYEVTACKKNVSGTATLGHTLEHIITTCEFQVLLYAWQYFCMFQRSYLWVLIPALCHYISCRMQFYKKWQYFWQLPCLKN